MLLSAARPFLERSGTLLALLLLARLAFLAFMPSTYAFDLHAWVNVVRACEHGGNPYVLTDHLVYLPLWPAVLRALALVNTTTGVPLIVCLQFFLIAVDAVNLMLVHRLITRSGRSSVATNALVFGMVLSPMGILLTMQHGNFDSLVATWLLLFLDAWWSYIGSRSPRSWLLACFFLGMGVLTKTVPMVMAPALLLGHWKKAPRTAILGVLAFIGPTVVSLLPFVTTDPQIVVQRVLSYHSYSGWFGITGLLGLSGFDGAMRLYVQAGRLIMIGLMAVATWLILSRPKVDGPWMLRLLLALLLGIIVFGPGYSPQYIGWYMPLLVLLYALAGVGERRWLASAYVIGTCTHLVEYALIPSHGAFLLHWTSNPGIVHLSETLREPGAQTILRIPLYVAYIATLFIVSRPLFEKRSWRTSPAN